MTQLDALLARASGDVFGLTNYQQLKVNNDWIVVAGADLASAGTIAPTNEFHKVTGTTTIDNIIPAVLTPVEGQQIRLLFAGNLTIRNNGGGAGNIRTFSGADMAVVVNQIVTFTWDGTNWRADRPAIGSSYRKNTSKQVLNSVAETDLLNGEITVAAGALGPFGVLRITAFGDWIQQSGASRLLPRFKLKLGGTVLLDTGASANTPSGTNAGRFGWRLAMEIIALGATNAQWVALEGSIGLFASSSGKVGFPFTVGNGSYTPIGDTSGTNTGIASLVGGNATAIDTTIANALVLSVINPTATATCDTTLQGALVEIV